MRLDTLEQEDKERVFYIGTNDTAVLTKFRRYMLSKFEHLILPVASEYLLRDIFNIAELYGKDTFMMIDKLGTGNMPCFFTLKGRIDASPNKLPLLPLNLTDWLMQGLSHLAPGHHAQTHERVPRALRNHLLLKWPDRELKKHSTI